MCKIIDPYTSSSAQVACAAAKRTKNYKENRKRGYEGQIKEPYMVETLQRKRGTIQRI